MKGRTRIAGPRLRCCPRYIAKWAIRSDARLIPDKSLAVAVTTTGAEFSFWIGVRCLVGVRKDCGGEWSQVGALIASGDRKQ